MMFMKIMVMMMVRMMTENEDDENCDGDGHDRACIYFNENIKAKSKFLIYFSDLNGSSLC